MSVAAAVEAALREVYDPCSQAWARPLSVVDLGLVRGMTVQPGGEVTIRLTPTTPMCLGVPVLMQAVEQRIAEVPGVSAVRVDIDLQAPWDAALMTERGRQLLTDRRSYDRNRTLTERTP